MLLLARRALLIALAATLVACQSKPASPLERIRSTKTLKVGLEGTYPPFSFQDAGGQLTGFDVAFARALAKRLGAEAVLQPAPFAGLLGAVEAGRSDVVINQITMTPERQAKFGFSQPYTVSGIQIIVLKDRSDISSPESLAGKKVGVGLGTNYESWLRANVPTAEVRTYDDDPTKYQDLKAGRIDAVLNDRLVAADFIKNSGEPFKAAGPTFAPQKQGVAFKPDPALRKAIDEAIDAMRADGELAGISNTWFGLDATR
ncbi:MAG: cystine ABC transporter substrate-binding protein [Cystobacter sp.]